MQFLDHRKHSKYITNNTGFVMFREVMTVILVIIRNVLLRCVDKIDSSFILTLLGNGHQKPA
jgi:hypothetical protein